MINLSALEFNAHQPGLMARTSTGLTGSYWSSENLGSRRSRKSIADKQAEEAKAAEEAAKAKKAAPKPTPSPKGKGGKRKQPAEETNEAEVDEPEAKESPAPPPAKKAARASPKPPTEGNVPKTAEDAQSQLSVMVTHNDMDKQKALAKEEVERAQAAAHFSQVPTAKS